MKTTLTDRAVARLVPPKQGRLEVLDAKMPGLALRVTPRGHKSWTVTWHQGRRARRHAIGAYPALTLATARDKARQVPAGLARGEDPIAARFEARFAPTVAALAAPIARCPHPTPPPLKKRRYRADTPRSGQGSVELRHPRHHRAGSGGVLQRTS